MSGWYHPPRALTSVEGGPYRSGWPVLPMPETFRGAPPEYDCFEDEVAIDFRSLATVVDRMRAAFFAGEEEPPSPSPRASQQARGRGVRRDP